MKKISLRRVVFGALFAALTYVATTIIRIPSFASVGYVNIGDAAVLLCAWILGGPWGALAAGAGSALADLLAGYGYYVPGTFTIKFCMALAASLIYRALSKKKKPQLVCLLASAVPAEIIMVCGYFLYKAFILGRYESALVSIFSNAVQGCVSTLIALALAAALFRSGALKQLELDR